MKTEDQVRDMLDFLHAKLDCCLVIDGESLQVSRLSYAILSMGLRAVVLGSV